MGTEDTGPVQIRGRAVFPKRRLWDAHGKFNVEMAYANGTVLCVADDSVFTNGIRFIGEDGWIFCSRGSAKVTGNDPGAGDRHGRWRPLEASRASLIEGKVEKLLTRNLKNHHRVWLESIVTRKPTNILLEAAHRSTTACILAYTALKLDRLLTWDPVTERFASDDEANATLSRNERAPYGVRNALKRAGSAS